MRCFYVPWAFQLLLLCVSVYLGIWATAEEPVPSLCENRKTSGLLEALSEVLKSAKGRKCPQENDKKGFTLTHHILPNTLTWQSSQLFCQGFGARLCTADQLCPPGKAHAVGVVTGDSWSPEGGVRNNWVQTGNRPHATCSQISAVTWGEQSQAHAFKGRVYCCKDNKPRKRFKWEEKNLGNKINWRDAVDACRVQGMSLCRAEQVCGTGVPLSGVRLGDHWTPVFDKDNEWIQTGDTHSSCLLHSTYGPPQWGTTHVQHVFKGRVFCCKEEPSECTTSDTDAELCSALATTNMCNSRLARNHCCKSCPYCAGPDKSLHCYLIDKAMCREEGIRKACCHTCKKIVE